MGVNASLVGAKAEIVSELTAAAATFGNSDVFAYQPDVSEFMKGIAVAVFTAGITPEFWLIGVRVLVSGTTSPKAAQDAMDAHMLAIDSALHTAYGPRAWTVEFATQDAPYYSATNILNVGREDL